MVFEIILGFVALLLAIGGLAILNRFSASSSVGGSGESDISSLNLLEEVSIAKTIQGALMEYMRSLYSERDPSALVYKANNLKKLFEKYSPFTKGLLEKMKSGIEASVEKYKSLEESLLRMYSGVKDITLHAYACSIGVITQKEAGDKIREASKYHALGSKVAEDNVDTQEKIKVAEEVARGAEIQAPTEEQPAP